MKFILNYRTELSIFLLVPIHALRWYRLERWGGTDSSAIAVPIHALWWYRFADTISDNFDERIEQKIFHAEIVVDSAKVSAEMKVYKKIPVIAEFTDSDGNDILRETIDSNYRRVKQEIIALVESETERIKNDPDLSKLLSV